MGRRNPRLDVTITSTETILMVQGEIETLDERLTRVEMNLSKIAEKTGTTIEDSEDINNG